MMGTKHSLAESMKLEEGNVGLSLKKAKLALNQQQQQQLKEDIEEDEAIMHQRLDGHELKENTAMTQLTPFDHEILLFILRRMRSQPSMTARTCRKGVIGKRMVKVCKARAL
eukprot:m.233270 g.233270  ORF g.233270 m.233270 type:complete len:112 (-) comp13906_c2_seq3:4711-5046(-)